jgi:hypothetical protein
VLNHINDNSALSQTGNTSDSCSVRYPVRISALCQLSLGFGIRVFPEFPHANVTIEPLRKSGPPPLTSFLINQTCRNPPECITSSVDKAVYYNGYKNMILALLVGLQSTDPDIKYRASIYGTYVHIQHNENPLHPSAVKHRT